MCTHIIDEPEGSYIWVKNEAMSKVHGCDTYVTVEKPKRTSMCKHVIGFIRDEPEDESEDALVVLVRLQRSLPLPRIYQELDNPFVFCPLCGGRLFRKAKS